MFFSPLYYLFLIFVAAAVAGKDISTAVNIATAYDSSLGDGWARYVYWQTPDGTIVMQKRDAKESTPVSQAISPRKNSPLSAYMFGLDDGYHQVVLSYLNDDDYIVYVSCREKDHVYDNWASQKTTSKASSGLVMVEVDRAPQFFYIDDRGYLTQSIDNSVSQLGPKAAEGSQLAMAITPRAHDMHLFFFSENKSLASLTKNGSGWAAVLPDMPQFGLDPKIGFAAAAWTDPPAVRFIYVNKYKTLNEWTLDGLDGGAPTWANTSDALDASPAVDAGEPVAASRSEAGSGRYLEYFYTVPRGQIEYLGRNDVDGKVFMVDFAKFELPLSEPTYTKDQKIALGTSISIGIVALIVAVAGLFVAKTRDSNWISKWRFLPWNKYSAVPAQAAAAGQP